MMWLQTLALLSSQFCVWQLTEGRPPAIIPRHQFNNVQSHRGPSFIDNRILHKENPPPRQFSNTVLQRRFKTNQKPQFNLQNQSPRALPLISSLRHNQQHAISLNAPTLGDAIKGLMSGSIEGHINKDLNQAFIGTPTSTASRPNVDIAIDFRHSVTSHSENIQDSSNTVTNNNSNSQFSKRNIDQNSNPINEVNNFGNTNSQDKAIILASPDYSDYSSSLDTVGNDPTLILLSDSGISEPNITPDFPDYSNVAATPREKTTLNIPDSGFPDPDYPPGFPDYSDPSAQNSNSPPGQGSNGFNIPDSGFPEPNFPADHPDYFDSIAPQSNSPSGQGSNDFNIPDSGFPEPNYPPDFPDYSTSVDSGIGLVKSDVSSPNSNSNSRDNNAPAFQSWDDFNQSYNPDDFLFPSLDNNNPSTDYNNPSPDYNAPSQDYNNGPQNFGSSDYSSPDYPQASSPSIDYNLDIPNDESPAKTIRTQQDLFDLVKISILDKLANGDRGSIGGGGNNGGSGNNGRGGNNGEGINNGGGRNSRGGRNVGGGRNNGGERNTRAGRNSPKSFTRSPGRQGSVNNAGSQNPIEQVLSFGQGVVDTGLGFGKGVFDAASGTGRALLGTGGQVIGAAHESITQTVDSVAKVIDDISRELLRSIKLVHGELQFFASDSLQTALEIFQKKIEIAQSVGGDFYRASLQVRDLFGRFISDFIENVSRFVGTAVNRTVDGAVKQAVSTGQFIGNLKMELLQSIVKNGESATQFVERGLKNTGTFMEGFGGVTTRFTNSATRTIG